MTQPASRMVAPRRLTTSLALIVVSLVGVSSCASGKAGDAAVGHGAAESFTVHHAQGTTEVPVKPQRIVSLDQTWSDALGGLDVDMAMVMHPEQLGSGGPWADWSADQEITYDGLSTTNPSADYLEDIGAVEPDLILAGYLPDQTTYDRLSEIAPTVGVVGGGVVNDWREVTTLAGEIAAEDDRADELVSDVETRIAKTKQTYKNLEGATGVFGQVSSNGLAVVTDEADPANEFLSDLGIVIPDNIQAAGDEGRTFISPEKIDLLDTDLMIMWPIDADPTDIAGWDNLSAVQNNTYFTADAVSANALSMPTVTSIPWALDQLDAVFSGVDELRR